MMFGKIGLFLFLLSISQSLFDKQMYEAAGVVFAFAIIVISYLGKDKNETFFLRPRHRFTIRLKESLCPPQNGQNHRDGHGQA